MSEQNADLIRWLEMGEQFRLLDRQRYAMLHALMERYLKVLTDPDGAEDVFFVAPRAWNVPPVQ